MFAPLPYLRILLFQGDSSPAPWPVQPPTPKIIHLTSLISVYPEIETGETGEIDETEFLRTVFSCVCNTSVAFFTFMSLEL